VQAHTEPIDAAVDGLEYPVKDVEPAGEGLDRRRAGNSTTLRMSTVLIGATRSIYRKSAVRGAADTHAMVRVCAVGDQLLVVDPTDARVFDTI